VGGTSSCDVRDFTQSLAAPADCSFLLRLFSAAKRTKAARIYACMWAPSTSSSSVVNSRIRITEQAHSCTHRVSVQPDATYMSGTQARLVRCSKGRITTIPTCIRAARSKQRYRTRLARSSYYGTDRCCCGCATCCHQAGATRVSLAARGKTDIKCFRLCPFRSVCGHEIALVCLYRLRFNE
jgi:hypothetical protein